MTEETRKLEVTEAGQRLDRFVTERSPRLSRTRVQAMIEAGDIRVNGDIVPANYRVENGDVIDLVLSRRRTRTLVPEPLPLSIIYQDEDLLVVDKPAGLTVHPGPGHPSSTLLNAVLARFPDIAGGDASRPGIVHRLDKDTSGLLVVALKPEVHQHLADQFKNRRVKKTYISLVEGRLSPREGFIEAPIGRDRSHRQRMVVAARGREARTGYTVREYFEGYTLLEVRPETGRTHQIRVHLSAIGHPVAGDGLYGARSPRIPRQFLHAYRLVFELPSTGEAKVFESPLPADLARVLDGLRS